MTMQLRGRIRFLVACVAVCAASSTLAQEEAVRIDEILVTAQKIEQNLQSVPIAVTAFTDEQLRVNRIEALVDIAQRTPGFTATEVNPAEPNLVIRGIGTEGIDSNAGGDASVVTFVDGVYIGRGGGANLDLLDLERVEVLRGPQGTLFGKNVVGGLVHLVTRKPSADDFGDLAATFGNFSRIEARGRFNKALSSTVFASGAIVYRKRDGYSFNATTGNDVDDEKISGARAALRLAPSSNLDVVFAVDATRQRQRGKPRDNVCNVTFNNGVHCVGVDPDPRVMNAVTDGHLRRDVEGISGEVNWKTGIGTVTSITAYRQAEFDFEDPFFSNPVNPPTQIESINRNVEDSDQFSQELRLAFSALGERLDAIVGAYFLSEKINRDEMLDQRFPAPAQQGRGSFPQEVDSDSTAVFGEIGFDFTDRLRGQLGGRMTWESKDAHLRGIRVAGPGFPPPLAAEYDVTASESWDAFTPRAILEWTAAEQAMIYASAARGFKSGGFQGTAGNGASAVIPYDP
ncbi:MAG: TonB-dependent receptor, partial [Steroidobacteraceae bacterium]